MQGGLVGYNELRSLYRSLALSLYLAMSLSLSPLISRESQPRHATHKKIKSHRRNFLKKRNTRFLLEPRRGLHRSVHVVLWNQSRTARYKDIPLNDSSTRFLHKFSFRAHSVDGGVTRRSSAARDRTTKPPPGLAAILPYPTQTFSGFEFRVGDSPGALEPFKAGPPPPRDCLPLLNEINWTHNMKNTGRCRAESNRHQVWGHRSLLAPGGRDSQREREARRGREDGPALHQEV